MRARPAVFPTMPAATLAQRLIWLMDYYCPPGAGQKRAFATFLGVSPVSITQWTTGERSPDDANRALIAQRCGTPEGWLETGLVEPSEHDQYMHLQGRVTQLIEEVVYYRENIRLRLDDCGKHVAEMVSLISTLKPKN